MATEYSINGGVISVTGNSGDSNTTEWVHDGAVERNFDSLDDLAGAASAFAETAAAHAAAAASSEDGAAAQAAAALTYASQAQDFAAEAAVESQLDAYGMIYTRQESYLSDDKMFMQEYEMEVLIDA